MNPSKCTPANVDAICKHLATPLPLSAALERAGVGKTTYYGWEPRAAENEEPYATAVSRIRAARMELLATLYARVATLAASGEKGDVVKLNATKHLIQHLFPEHDPARKLELSGPEGKPIAHTHEIAADDLCASIDALAAELTAGARPGDPQGRGGADGAGGAGGGPR